MTPLPPTPSDVAPSLPSAKKVQRRIAEGVSSEHSKVPQKGSSDSDSVRNGNEDSNDRKKLHKRSSSLSERLFESAHSWMYRNANSDSQTCRSILDDDKYLDYDDDSVLNAASDGESMGTSVAYFESTDFARANWHQSLHMIPPIGFAAVATGLVFMHPVVFIAGALTAFGTVQVVGAGYDWCMHPNDPLPSTATSSRVTDHNHSDDHDVPRIIRNILFCDRDTTASSAMPIAHTQSQKQVLQQNNDSNINSKHLAGECASNESDNTAPDDWDDDDDDDFVCDNGNDKQTNIQSLATLAPHQQQNALAVPPPCLAGTTAATPAVYSERPRITPKSEAAKLRTIEETTAWISRHFPRLANTAVENRKFHGLNAKEFFHVFFGDNAPFTYQEFQKQRQDKDIHYEEWASVTLDKPSMHHTATPMSGPAIDAQRRILKFQAKTRSFFGPPYAKTTKIQHAICPSKRLLVIESKTTVKEIPFCDKFCVLERWIVTAARDPVTKVYDSTLSVHSEAIFTSSCPFESKIKSTSNSTICDIANAWCDMAQEALKLSERNRFERLQNEATDWDDSLCEDDQHLIPVDAPVLTDVQPNEEHDENIEIRHLRGSQSWVLEGNGDNETQNMLPPDLPIDIETDALTKLPPVPNRRRLSSFTRSISKIIPRRRKSAHSCMSQ